MSEKVGVIIARLQPIHNGHLELIKQALNENDSVLLLVGSADKLNKRNPIPINMRLEMATKAIHETFGADASELYMQLFQFDERMSSLVMPKVRATSSMIFSTVSGGG